MLGDPGGQRGSRWQESAEYWTVYVIGVYEHETATDGNFLDNDDATLGDTEVASTGWTRTQEPEYSVIPKEVIRDVASQHGWSDAQTAAVQQWAVVHEIGHQFDLEDDFQGEHTHAMCSYETDVPGERDQHMNPVVFNEEDMLTIRRDTESP